MLSAPSLVALGLAVGLAGGATGCTPRAMTEEECDHLLGRGIALVSFPGDPEPRMNVENVKQRARGAAKEALTDFAHACVGAKEDGLVMCQRRVKTDAQFKECGALAQQAYATARATEGAIVKHHTTEQCAKYAEHGVQIGAGTADEVGDFHRDCDGWMEVGVYRCRLAAKDKATWRGCDTAP